MPQLFFKKPFQEAIRAKLKNTTIRRWSRPMLEAGQKAFSPGLGWLAIEAVDVVCLDDLNDADANADGFPNARDMRRLLIELYPSHATDQKQWFRVRFRLDRLQSRPKRYADESPRLF